MDLSINFDGICEHMAEKFGDKDTKKDYFSKQMEFCKKSDDRYSGFNLLSISKTSKMNSEFYVFAVERTGPVHIVFYSTCKYPNLAAA